MAAEKELRFALTGNPNSGKTSIFNIITGTNQKTGNWGGVTVDVKAGTFRQGKEKGTIIDLPGTYSLSAYTMEEIVARDVIIRGDEDLIINVIDASNLEGNLYLGIQIMEMGRPVVFAFNMSDELKRSGTRVETEALSRLFGIPICFTVGRNGEGVDALISEAIQTARGKHPAGRTRRVHYGKELEGVLFSANDGEVEPDGELRAALARSYSPQVGLAFLVFVMLYTPCIVAFVTLIREIGSWKWSIFSLFYQLALAWIAAFLVYQIGIYIT